MPWAQGLGFTFRVHRRNDLQKAGAWGTLEEGEGSAGGQGGGGSRGAHGGLALGVGWTTSLLRWVPWLMLWIAAAQPETFCLECCSMPPPHSKLLREMLLQASVKCIELASSS